MVSLFNSLLQQHLAPSILPGPFFTANECSCLKHLCKRDSQEFLNSIFFFYLFSFFFKSPHFRSLLPLPPVSTHASSPGQRHDCDKTLNISSCRDSQPGLAALAGTHSLVQPPWQVRVSGQSSWILGHNVLQFDCANKFVKPQFFCIPPTWPDFIP